MAPMMSRGQFLHERELKRQAIKLADSLSHLEGADAKTVLQYAIDLVTWLDAIDAKIGRVEPFPAARRVP